MQFYLLTAIFTSVQVFPYLILGGFKYFIFKKSIDIYLTATQGSDGDKKKVVACFDVEKLDKDEKMRKIINVK